MTIQQIYELGIEMAIKADPRGEKGAKKQLQKCKKGYESLPEKDKTFFDTESLINPYADSRVLYGDPSRNVKKILAGIDTNASEILLADRLNQKGEEIDVVIGHHPEGAAWSSLHEVMDLQIDVFAELGVPVNLSDSLMRKRMSEVGKRLRPLNHNQAVDTARLLEIPLMVLHTIWDNIGDQFIKNYLKGKDFETVGELLNYLLEIPEYQEARKGNGGPVIVAGDKEHRAGKVSASFTGGTSPSKEMFVEAAKAGIGTFIEMHVKDDMVEEMKKMHVNIIETGHMASDSIGANIFFDALEEHGITIIPCSGFIRIKRNKREKK